MSDSVRPHRWKPTRLPCPWDSPGKNDGVGCHFLLQCMKVKSESEVTQSCPTLHDPMDCSLPGSSAHKIFQASVLEWVAIAFSPLYDYMIVNKFLLLLMDICFFQLWALRNNSFFFLFFFVCVCDSLVFVLLRQVHLNFKNLKHIKSG